MSSIAIKKIFENHVCWALYYGLEIKCEQNNMCCHEVYNAVENTMTKCSEKKEHNFMT